MAVTAAQLENILPYFPAKDLSAFHVESLLGGGGFSHVVLARDAAGKEWALKLIPAPGASRLDDVDGAPLLLTEARAHLLLTGEPSVLPCLEAFKSVYVDERGVGGGGARHATFMAVLRMPVASCSVEEWLFSASPMRHACQGAPKSQVDEEEALGVWLQMVNAVHRCHAHGIVHKDIKLPNFLMDGRGMVQIMDFGLAQVEGVTPRSVAGTPWTMSPAGLKHGDDGRSGDWWALGVVLFQLLQGGAWPFKHCWWPWQKGGGERMEAAIRHAVLAGRIAFHGMRVSEPLKALIRGLLQPDPNRRWQLRQVLASDAVRPELLVKLSERFPELAPDMQALVQLQRRARSVQALGSGGGGGTAAAGAVAAAGAAAAGLVTAGSVFVAAASTVLRGHGVSSLVGEGGLHWPHWTAGKGEAAGGNGSSHRPLLDGEDREEAALGGLPGRYSGPSGATPRRLSGGIAPSDAQAVAQQQQLPPPPQQAEDARVADLLLLFPNELPDAHPSPPGAPRPDAPPQAAAAAPGLVPTASGGNDLPPASGRALSSAVGGPTSLTTVGFAGMPHHRNIITSLVAQSGSDLEARGPSSTSASGPMADAGEGSQRRRASSHSHTPSLSRRSLSGPQGSPVRGPSSLGAQPNSPSPRHHRSRTSLSDLFGAPSISQPLQPSLHPHAHQRVASAAGLGGLLGTAADFMSGGGAAGRHPRGSWAMPRRQSLSLQPPGPGLEGEEAEQGVLPESSWVPPPPEAFAAGSGTIRPLVGGRVAAVGPLAAGTGGDAGASHGPGAAPQALLQQQQQHHHQPHHHHHRGLLAKARRLFSDCLQRPGVQYDMYDYEEYGALPQPVPAKAL